MIETVGGLRKALEGYPEDLKILASIPDEGVFGFWTGRIQRVEKYEVRRKKEGVTEISSWFLEIKIEKKGTLE